jgi:poly(3-hydroxybutyrate) depolymerase
MGIPLMKVEHSAVREQSPGLKRHGLTALAGECSSAVLIMSLLALMLCALFPPYAIAATAPTQVARVAGSTSAPYGYVESLPSAYYDNPTTLCPLVIFLHGAGEQGPGTDTTALMNAIVQNSSPHALIQAGGTLGARFNSENAICLGPQSPGWWDSSTLHRFLTYAYATYPMIDRARVYMVGPSMGGGGTWDYISAHGEDVAGVIPGCGASYPTNGIKSAGVAIWAFHAWDDPVITRQTSIGWCNEVARWIGGLAAPTDLMAGYPYGDGTSTVAANHQTATFSAAGGWVWTPGTNAATSPSLKLTMYTTGGHDGGWSPAVTNSQVWDWLFAQRLNAAPTISAIADQSVAAGSSTVAIPFTIGDSATAATALTVSAATANAHLIPVSGLVFGGSGANRTVVITPVAGVGGVGKVIIQVSDGVRSATRSFVVTVTGGTTTTFTIEIDCGAAIATASGDGPSAAPINNLTNYLIGSEASALATTGTATGIGIAVSDGFAGIVSTGLAVADHFPATAQADVFLTQASGDNVGAITLSNLNPLATYDLDLFASHTVADNRTATDNRTSIYTVNGLVRMLNAANNTGTLASFSALTPVGTTLTLSVAAAAGSDYGYLGALRLVQRPLAAANQAPTVSNAIGAISLELGTTLTVVVPVTTFADAEGDPLSYTASGMPDGVTFDPNTRTFAGTVNAAGSNTITLTAHDGRGGSVSTQLILTVTSAAMPVPPSPTPIFFLAGEKDSSGPCGMGLGFVWLLGLLTCLWNVSRKPPERARTTKLP